MEETPPQKYAYIGLIGKVNTSQYLLCDMEEATLNHKNVLFNLTNVLNIINKSNGVDDDLSVLFYCQ